MTTLDDKLDDTYWPNFINGAYCDGGAGRISVTNPATGEVFAEQALADAADVDRAVQAARSVHLSGHLKDMHPMERGRMVRRIGSYLADNIEAIKRSITLEQGKPLFESEAEIKLAIRLFDYFGSMAESLEGRSIPSDSTRFDFTVYEPLGVSAQFMPCHYPIYIPSRALSVALATGNTCVMKTAEIAPISTLWLARAAEAAGFPAGAVNIFCGRREDAGLALSTHPDINHLVFIGRQSAATDVLSRAAGTLVPSIVEVGGTSPTLVFEDGDLDAFTFEARMGSYWNAGQFCCGMFRIIVHESRYEELVDRAVALAESLEVGPGIDSGDFRPYMGAMDSEEQLQKVLAMVDDARRNGAKCVTGGERLRGPGFFMKPTVLRDVDPAMSVAQEEVWGPVMSVLKFGDEDEAYRLANGPRHSGLMCGVFTKDLGRMMRAAARVRAGHIVSNQTLIGGAELPFGGFNRAGYGSLKGREAMLGYVQRKNVLLNV
ncbi:aldehyde dehydrogenase family protein [Burkholderia ubonensis]|uniref:aldehyde dehydrogenase family protein n=1 Tax=Burkholderia ubonensis TaxID=101571 RepID=UPI00075576A7|nr:aldehyde dehydrogenase family protein [Burkholderia ubonensis]KVG71046.1 aldehyde dehydrogenase [Burkholderia ubonensis]KVH22722.1 aldehyde dehydrogenase [Burkholderia ubonensis]KVH43112.1 aldehyde dehydrogenase [Burkholderia ubonensis]KVH85846.1 aldehyde dehydrogenase [Burkholderia ubonensis]KVM28281.1 aldehyde dehydrogenase [Burkholderia ubonensis]